MQDVHVVDEDLVEGWEIGWEAEAWQANIDQ